MFLVKKGVKKVIIRYRFFYSVPIVVAPDELQILQSKIYKNRRKKTERKGDLLQTKGK